MYILTTAALYNAIKYSDTFIFRIDRVCFGVDNENNFSTEPKKKYNNILYSIGTTR